MVVQGVMAGTSSWREGRVTGEVPGESTPIRETCESCDGYFGLRRCGQRSVRDTCWIDSWCVPLRSRSRQSSVAGAYGLGQDLSRPSRVAIKNAVGSPVDQWRATHPLLYAAPAIELCDVPIISSDSSGVWTLAATASLMPRIGHLVAFASASWFQCCMSSATPRHRIQPVCCDLYHVLPNWNGWRKESGRKRDNKRKQQLPVISSMRQR